MTQACRLRPDRAEIFRSVRVGRSLSLLCGSRPPRFPRIMRVADDDRTRSGRLGTADDRIVQSDKIGNAAIGTDRVLSDLLDCAAKRWR